MASTTGINLGTIDQKTGLLVPNTAPSVDTTVRPLTSDIYGLGTPSADTYKSAGISVTPPSGPITPEMTKGQSLGFIDQSGQLAQPIIAPAPVPYQMPALPKPAPFTPVVPTTLDSKTVSKAYSSPAKVDPALQQLMQEQENLALYGNAYGPNAVNLGGGNYAPAPTGSVAGSSASGATGGTPPPAPVPANVISPDQLKALFPEQEKSADAYQKLREQSGVAADEAALADEIGRAHV